ncbi:hypothetical protein ACH3XW_19240 [Acanthocheilonema viteae]
MSASIYYFIVSIVCTTPSLVLVCYKKKDKSNQMLKEKSAKDTESAVIFSNIRKSGVLSLRSTQTDEESSTQSNAYQMTVTQSTQDDSTLTRGRGTSIYEKMTKEQMLQAGKTQFNKLSSDAQRKSRRLGKPTRSTILSKRLVELLNFIKILFPTF